MPTSDTGRRSPGLAFPVVSAVLLLAGSAVFFHAVCWATEVWEAERKLNEVASAERSWERGIDLLVGSVRSEEAQRYLYLCLALALWLVRLLAINAGILARVRRVPASTRIPPGPSIGVA